MLTPTGAAGGAAEPDAAALDRFVHQAVDDWKGCPLKPETAALLELAEKLTRTPAAMREPDIAHLRGVGWQDEAIHDAIQVIAYFNYINRFADAVGLTPEPSQPTWGTPSPGDFEPRP
jgi:uncharacterized peroxidase-related enzyme